MPDQPKYTELDGKRHDTTGLRYTLTVPRGTEEEFHRLLIEMWAAFMDKHEQKAGKT